MDITNLTDTGLVEKGMTIVRSERELLTEFLHILREIERRRLFSSLGYRSLFDMTMQYFGYSEDQAHRRISAMRLLKSIPEIEEKMSSGQISLSHISVAQSFFNQEKKSSQKEFTKTEKILLFERIENTSVREAKKVTLSMLSSPAEARPDRIKLVTDTRIELKFQASAELQDKIEKLKGFLAHQSPGISLGELFEKLCDLGLEHWTPGGVLKRKAKAEAEAKSKAKPKANRPLQDDSPQSSQIKPEGISVSDAFQTPQRSRVSHPETWNKFDVVWSSPPQSGFERDEAATFKVNPAEIIQPPKKIKSEVTASAQKEKATIRETETEKIIQHKKTSAAQLRRDVFHNAHFACENCGSTFALEMDHVVPQAKGGTSTPENLRILCRACNQRAAIMHFGLAKMDLFLNSFTGL